MPRAVIREALWRLRRRDGVLEWAALLVWLAIAFRLVGSTGISRAGLFDDLAVVSGGLVLYALLEHVSPRLRAAVLFAAGFGLITAYASTLLFFRFYQSYIRVGTLAMTGAVGGGVSSVFALFTPTFLIGCVIGPIALLGSATARGSGRRGHAVPGLLLGALAVCAATLAFGRGSAESFVAADNDPVIYLLRDAVHALRERQSPRAALRPLDMLISRDETYNFAFERGLRSGASSAYPLLRLPVATADGGRGGKGWNVVLVLMESVRGFETNFTHEAPAVAPNLTRLAEQGVFFSNVYFNATQTAPAEASVLCSVLPDSAGGPIYLKSPRLSVRCLPEILSDHGYETHWISSFHASFTNKREFLSAHGVRFIHDQTDLERRGLKREKIGWAAADDDLADFATEILDRAHEPFFAEVMTVSNHFPWELDSFGVPVPAAIRSLSGSGDYRGYLMGMHYTDHAVGRFLEGARSHQWFDRTLFVIVGDHGVWIFPETADGQRVGFLEKTEIYYRSGLVFWAPSLLASRRVDTVGSEIDLAPTILDVLGIADANSFEGVSLLAEVPPERRFAMMVSESSWSVRAGDRYCYALGQSCFTDAEPRCAPGEKPRAAARACFRYTKDLLDFTVRPGELIPLSEAERAALVARGDRLVRYNDALIRRDGFFPPELRAGAR